MIAMRYKVFPVSVDFLSYGMNKCTLLFCEQLPDLARKVNGAHACVHFYRRAQRVVNGSINGK
eukprot:scaffold26767_cov117-Cylindrotheca_fusiformis.AAC.2